MLPTNNREVNQTIILCGNMLRPHNKCIVLIVPHTFCNGNNYNNNVRIHKANIFASNSIPNTTGWHWSNGLTTLLPFTTLADDRRRWWQWKWIKHIHTYIYMCEVWMQVYHTITLLIINYIRTTFCLYVLYIYGEWAQLSVLHFSSDIHR